MLLQVHELLRVDRLRLLDLLGGCQVRQVGAEELVDIDPELGSQTNVNRPQDYLDALNACGLTASPEHE